jgi:hypothetical protein
MANRVASTGQPRNLLAGGHRKLTSRGGHGEHLFLGVGDLGLGHNPNFPTLFIRGTWELPMGLDFPGEQRPTRTNGPSTNTESGRHTSQSGSRMRGHFGDRTIDGQLTCEERGPRRILEKNPLLHPFFECRLAEPKPQ